MGTYWMFLQHLPDDALPALTLLKSYVSGFIHEPTLLRTGEGSPDMQICSWILGAFVMILALGRGALTEKETSRGYP